MKRSFISLVLTSILALGNIAPAHAYASLSSCLSGRGSGSVSGNTLTLTINLTITCTLSDPKDPKKQATFYSLFYTDFPVYEIQEEMFSSSACNGPLLGLTLMISGTSAGNVTCRLSNSSRYGATSSTLKIYAGDSVFVPISHPAIPKPGSTSGSTGGSTGGTSAAPVTPSCTSAPSTPTLSIEWNSTGPKFIYSPNISGQKATALFWNYSLYNSVTRKWEDWSAWKMENPSAGSFQAIPEEGKSRIAFGLQAANACGASQVVREREDLTGIPLTPKQQDVVIRNVTASPDLKVGFDADINQLAESKLNLKLLGKSLTPAICTVNQTQVVFKEAGLCRLLVSSVTEQYEFGAEPTEISFEITKQVSQNIPELNLDSSYFISTRNVELSLRTDAALTVRFKSLSPKICQVLGSTLAFVNTGSCILEASQEGDTNTLPAPVRNFEIWIDSDPLKSITCIKGKLAKKVSGSKPKCPTGYKLKK